jgi:hypothetical protein
MPATLTTIDSILKDYYVGPLQEELNNEVMCLQMFEKAKLSWSGRACVVPVHVARNAGVGYRGENTPLVPAALPNAGDQGLADLRIGAHYLYGSFELTGQAIASARKGGAGSFVEGLRMEMDKLKDDVRNAADVSCVSGGDIAGFTLPGGALAPGFLTPGTGYVDVPNATAFRVRFRGDWQKLIDVAGAAVNVEFINVSNETLSGVGAGSSYDVIGTADIAVVGDINQAAGTVDMTSTSIITFSDVAPGYTTALRIVGGDPVPFGLLAQQPIGIYGNLASTNHFGVDRSSGQPAVPLQSLILIGDNVGDVAQDLDLERMQTILDELNELSGADPNVMIVHPSMRAKYMAQLSGTISATGNAQLNTDTTKATTGDGGFLGLSYGGIPIKTARHVGRGMVIFLSTKTWRMAELQAGKFADLDGNIIERVAGADSWGGFYKWYYNHYTFRPNANAILTGLLAGGWTS